MALESATYISQLVDTNPAGSDVISQGDDHLRLIKEVLQSSLPDVDQAATTIITKATAPTTQIKGTIWYDTSANLLKINTASTASTPAWVTVNAGAPWAASASLASTTAFRATMSGNQDIANNTTATITFDTDGTAPTSFDLGGNFDTTTYKYTAPNTGQYYIGAATRWIGPSGVGLHSMDDNMYIYRHPDGGSAAIAVNFNTMMKDTIAGEGNYIGAVTVYQMSSVLSLTALDAIYIRVFTDSGDAFRVTAGHFEGFQIA